METGLTCRMHFGAPFLQKTPLVLRPQTATRPSATAIGRRARASSKEDAIASMQAFKVGLANALASREESLRADVGVKAAAVDGETATTTSGLRELTCDDFHSFIEESNNAGRLVLVDFYTDWCGPCKLMLPLLEQMAVDLEGKVDIVKFNCNKKNKELGQSLGIKVAPTFHIYRDTVQVAMMTGAKIDELKELINKHL